jgi:uncharacterized membrane protein
MMRDPLRHHRKHRSKDENVFGDSLAERISEKVATGMGTVQFIILSTLVIIAWTMVNHLPRFLHESYEGLLHGKGFDPAPFILLNLMFSAVAFYTGALVIIAAKAQAKKSNAQEEAEAKHREELAAEQVRLLEQNTELTVQVHQLTLQIHDLVGVKQSRPSRAKASPKA